MATDGHTHRQTLNVVISMTKFILFRGFHQLNLYLEERLKWDSTADSELWPRTDGRTKITRRAPGPSKGAPDDEVSSVICMLTTAVIWCNVQHHQ